MIRPPPTPGPREAGDGEAGAGETKMQALDAFGVALARTRSEAIEGRRQTGIEDEWLEDEEHYEGIDDANRGESRAWRTKPPGREFIGGRDRASSSTVFLNVTRPYCDASAAKVSDMLLPTDDPGWALTATPLPDLAAIASGEIPGAVAAALERAFPGNPEAQAAQAEQLAQQAALEVEAATEAATRATRQIEDWHVEGMYHAEMRRVIEWAAKLGSGSLKGPVPERRRAVAYRDGALIVQDKILPVSRCIIPWNLYPDPGCGPSIHDGGYIWERDDITAKRLTQLRGAPGYIDGQIARVLREGPHVATREAPERPEPGGTMPVREGKNLYEIWYYHGEVSREDLLACVSDEDGRQLLEEQEEIASFAASVTMVNNRVIRAVLNPLDTGDLPYDIMVWQRREGMPWGIGVSRQIRTCQRIINAATRNLMDNSGRAGGPQVIVQHGLVTPADGVYEIRPWKIWTAAEDADVAHIDNAFRFVAPPMLAAELQNIILLGLRMCEDVAGLPMMMQGQQSPTTPTTLGGMQLMHNAANTVLRRIARLYDDLITEPHIRRYYAYLLQYGEDDGAKGDLQVDARGSSALVEREVANQAVLMLPDVSLNPVYRLDPAKVMREVLKAQKLDPRRFVYEDEEWAQMVQQILQPAPTQDSAVAVAEIRAQVESMKAELRAQGEQARLAHQAQQAEADRALSAAQHEIDAQIEMARLAGADKQTLDRVKAAIGQTVMKLRTQRELASMAGPRPAGAARAVPEATTPPTEPPQLAPPGESFQQ